MDGKQSEKSKSETLVPDSPFLQQEVAFPTQDQVGRSKISLPDDIFRTAHATTKLGNSMTPENIRLKTRARNLSGFLAASILAAANFFIQDRMAKQRCVEEDRIISRVERGETA